jgi:hypothetical protein
VALAAGVVGLLLAGQTASAPTPHLTDDTGKPFDLHFVSLDLQPRIDLRARPPSKRRLLRIAGPSLSGQSAPRLIPELRMGDLASEAAIAAGAALLLFGTVFVPDTR